MTQCLWLWGRWGILKVEGVNDTPCSPGQKHSKVQDAHLKPVKKTCLITLQNKRPNTAVGCCGDQVHQVEETASH